MKFPEESAEVNTGEEGRSARQTQQRLRRVAYWLSFGAAASILFSIALSQFLLGLAIAAVLASRQKFRLPPIQLPLLVFFLLTLLAVLFSPDPIGAWPQIKKLYVFTMLPVVFTSFTNSKQIRQLVLVWSAIGFLSAIQSAVQYVHRYHLAQEQYAYNYGFFLDGRVTGLASHWMTFGGEQMIVLLMLFSYLLFAAEGRWRWYAGFCVVVLWASIILGLTRSIFLLGVPAGATYLLWKWKPWLVSLVPALLLTELFFGPVQVRERVVSAVSPHEELDSNKHRITTRRTGWNMIKQHPWLGLGPEQIGPQFLHYLPPDIPRPLPKGYYAHLHNIYLQYAAERGIPALLALLWFIGKVLWDFYAGARRFPSDPNVRFVLHGSIATIIAILLEGLFEYNLGDSEILTLFLTVVACGYLSLKFAAVTGMPGQVVVTESISERANTMPGLLPQT
jgi:putative inorganic carbon (hco3(-)) transporter